MTPSTKTTRFFLLFLTAASFATAQSSRPASPSNANASSPVATLSTSSVSFGPLAVNTLSNEQTVTVTNTGGQPLAFSSLPAISGANAGDFSVNDTSCDPRYAPVASGGTCLVTVNFMPQLEGSRTATLTFTDNSGGVTGAKQSVQLSGSGIGSLPSGLTTYLGDYGSVVNPFTGPEAILPVRAYNPGGAAQIAWVETFLTAGGANRYWFLVDSTGPGVYNLAVYSVNGQSAAYPNVKATGNTVVLASPITVGAVAIRAFRLALVGNEFQLDLTVSRTGAFTDQIVVEAYNNVNYSASWGSSDGQWSSAPAAGSTCNGTRIATSILVGAGSWQCWSASQLNTVATFGDPYWNGLSGDGRQSNIGWLLAGTGNENHLPGSAPGTLGYFAPAGGGGSNNLYFASTGTQVTVNLVVALTSQNDIDTLGWYSIDPTSPDKAPSSAAMHRLVGPFTSGPLSATFTPAGYYGLYIISPVGTYFSQPQFNSDALQHFAVFQQSAGLYYVGAEDTDAPESDMDYNDMVITLSVAAPPTTGIELSPASLTFANQIVQTASASQTVTVTNSGTATLTITSGGITGTNPGDFSITGNTCGSVAAGASCTVTVAFKPTVTGSRTASLALTDNAAGSPQTVALGGTGVAAPAAFTTYLAPYGSGFQTIPSANSALLPLRAYNPTGAAQIVTMETALNTNAGVSEYLIYAKSNGAGGYTLQMNNSSAGTTPLTMTASGNTVILATPITLGSLQITAYRFALSGNEFQLDLSVTRSGTFTDQIVIYADYGTNYSFPWGTSNGQWSN